MINIDGLLDANMRKEGNGLFVLKKSTPHILVLYSGSTSKIISSYKGATNLITWKTPIIVGHMEVICTSINCKEHTMNNHIIELLMFIADSLYDP